jgi:hypothetical protein
MNASGAARVQTSVQQKRLKWWIDTSLKSSPVNTKDVQSSIMVGAVIVVFA